MKTRIVELKGGAYKDNFIADGRGKTSVIVLSKNFYRERYPKEIETSIVVYHYSEECENPDS